MVLLPKHRERERDWLAMESLKGLSFFKVLYIVNSWNRVIKLTKSESNASSFANTVVCTAYIWMGKHVSEYILKSSNLQVNLNSRKGDEPSFKRKHCPGK